MTKKSVTKPFAILPMRQNEDQVPNNYPTPTRQTC